MSNSTTNRGKLRLALLPHAGCVCEQCLRVASYGFHYKEPFNPHGEKNFDCECELASGVPEETQIQGVDFEEYGKMADAIKSFREYTGASDSQIKSLFKSYEITSIDSNTANRMTESWKACSDTCMSKEYSDVLIELSTRTREWFIFGKSSKPKYEKSRDSMTFDEKVAIDALSFNGFDNIIAYVEEGGALSNIDFGLQELLCEAKNVVNDSSVSNQLGRVRKKWYKLEIEYPPYAVFTTNGAVISIEEIEKGILKRLRHGEQVLLVYGDKKIKRLTKK